MKPEAQRIAIAETRGWVWYRLPNPQKRDREYRMLDHPTVHEYEGQSPEWLVRADGTERICNFKFMEENGYLPDFTRDLTAIHSEVSEFLKSASKEQMELWRDNLFRAVGLDPDRYKGHYVPSAELAKLTLATAPQHCEAFLKTLGLWKDE